MEVARTKLGIGLQKVESGHFKGFGQGGIAMCKPFPSRLEKAVENLVNFDNSLVQKWFKVRARRTCRRG